MTTLEVLRAARKLIANRERWTKGTLYADPDGVRLPTPEGATQFCSVGALTAVAWLRQPQERDCAVQRACDALTRATPVGYPRPVFVNDWAGHAAALAMYDRAIRAEEAREAEFRVAPEPEPELIPA